MHRTLPPTSWALWTLTEPRAEAAVDRGPSTEPREAAACPGPSTEPDIPTSMDIDHRNFPLAEEDIDQLEFPVG